MNIHMWRRIHKWKEIHIYGCECEELSWKEGESILIVTTEKKEREKVRYEEQERQFIVEWQIVASLMWITWEKKMVRIKNLQ